MFYYMSFLILGLKFKTLIHFELIFGYGVRQQLNFIILHMAVQFPTPLIDETVVCVLYILGSFVIN